MLCGRYLHVRLVLLHTLYGFVENVIVVRTRKKYAIELGAVEGWCV